ncbi:major facilitator superfamily transporter [Histomonas meleagridis]|uniref:major facilitator superfamily transporter n=1 Tax=Histomonas meleagridis TaxID=135588 RepID=UPI00355A577B|nr:major facilitator superfamily transporter [Histomonas meleagridis]KAH0804523.1 major facilitator superfamily transporter [Histomonas meleagridis]
MGWPYIPFTPICCFILAMGGVTMGVSLSYCSPALPQIQEEFHLSSTEATCFNVMSPVCGMIGCIICSFLTGRIGRRWCTFICAVFTFLTWIFLALPKVFWLLMLLRCLNGFSLGFFSSVTPIFIVEVAPPRYTGLFGYMHQLGTAFGYWYPNLVGNTVSAWRDVTYICSIPSGILMLGSLFISDRVGPTKGASYGKVFKYKKQMLIAMFILLIQQFSGINALQSNLRTILSEARISNASIIETMATVCQILTTIAASFIVDRWGRRNCWILSTVLQFIAFLLLAIQQIAQTNGALFIVGLFVEQLSYGFGMGPIPFLVVAELYPEEVRSASMALMTVTCWLFAAVVMLIWPVMEESLTVGYCFLVFSIISIVALLFGISQIDNKKAPKKEEEDLIANEEEEKESSETAKALKEI